MGFLKMTPLTKSALAQRWSEIQYERKRGQRIDIYNALINDIWPFVEGMMDIANIHIPGGRIEERLLARRTQTLFTIQGIACTALAQLKEGVGQK